MTLSTDLVIIEPTDPRAVFDFALALLAKEGGPDEPRWDYTRKGEGTHYPARSSHYATTCGQGLAAWLFVHHADDGPLTLHDPEWDDSPPPPCDEHCIRVDWDTAYSYRSKSGEGCGDLHARMVATVGHWLDEKGLTWWWHNEFTGEWHKGYDGLDQLGNAGDEAMAWFNTVALPAIESGLLR